MQDAVIVSAVRTPVGRFGGALRDVQAPELGAVAVREAVKRAQLEGGEIDEVIMGHVLVNGETPNVARLSALIAGLPVEVPAYTLDRQCSSGLQAIINAVMAIQTGNANIVVAGGVESESNAEYYVTGARWGLRMGSAEFKDRLKASGEMVSCPQRFGCIPGMMHTAENLIERYQISRQEQDEFALWSHQNAVAAINAGKFDEEMVPVEVPAARGERQTISRDEHPRADTSLEKLARLPALLGKTVTAGNSSGINDAAAACVVMEAGEARRRGLEPMGRVVAWAAAGCPPDIMGIGPAPAVRKLLAKTKLTLRDVDLIELNEAFAGQALAVLKDLGVTDLSNVNVNGSGISIGHPIGATGARIMATLLHEMGRRQARYAIETMCIGGGMGLAALVERPQ